MYTKILICKKKKKIASPTLQGQKLRYNLFKGIDNFERLLIFVMRDRNLLKYIIIAFRLAALLQRLLQLNLNSSKYGGSQTHED